MNAEEPFGEPATERRTVTYLPEFTVLEHVTPPSLDAGNWEGLLGGERGMYAADEQFAVEHGGPVTRHLISSIPDSYRNLAWETKLQLNIDVRVHLLGKGEYPATPGWHCDASMRETRFDHDAPTYPVENTLIVNVSTASGVIGWAGVSNTEFVTVPVTCVEETLTAGGVGGGDPWAALNRTVEETVPAQSRYVTSDGDWVQFTSNAPHRATEAVRTGTRLFMRVSLWTPPAGHKPGLTRTEQTYRLLNSTV